MYIKRANKVLLAAGIYNILWGSFVALAPRSSFELLGAIPPQPIEIWQCVGMIVGVYGLGYLIAASQPYRHWPIILVGLIGKVLGPIGFATALYQGIFPLSFGVHIIFNDLIWWLPFGLLLLKIKRRYSHGPIKRVSEAEILRFEERYRAAFINSLSGFKSANLIGTIDQQGLTNLSIVSSAFHLGASPALMGLIIRPDRAARHTLDNLRETKVCTLNHVQEKIIMAAHQTSARYEKEQSEFHACGLTEEFQDNHQAPFVKESQVKMALELVREIELTENGAHMLILKIKDVYLPAECIEKNGAVDIERAGSTTVSGLDSYHQTSRVGRLSYAKVDKSPSWLD